MPLVTVTQLLWTYGPFSLEKTGPALIGNTPAVDRAGLTDSNQLRLVALDSYATTPSRDANAASRNKSFVRYSIAFGLSVAHSPAK